MVRLSAENTAIVLDSTSDLSGGQTAARAGASSRSTCASATRGAARVRRHLDRRVLPPPARERPAAEERAALAGRLRRASTRSSPATSGSSASSSPRSSRARSRAPSWRPRTSGGEVRRRSTRGVTSGGTVILADAIQRRLDRGTDDDEIDALVERFRRDARPPLHRGHARVPRPRRAVGKAAGLAGQLLSVKPILALRRRRGRAAQARARPGEGAGRARGDLPRLDGGTGRPEPARRRRPRRRARRTATKLVRSACRARGRTRRSTSSPRSAP